jgi:hypothetical protein
MICWRICRTTSANKHPPGACALSTNRLRPVFFRPLFSSRLQVRPFGFRRPFVFGCALARQNGGAGGLFFPGGSGSGSGGRDMRAMWAVSGLAGIWAPIHGANGTAGPFRPFKRHTPAPRRMRAAPPITGRHTMLQLLLLPVCCKKGKNRHNPLI